MERLSKAASAQLIAHLSFQTQSPNGIPFRYKMKTVGVELPCRGVNCHLDMGSNHSWLSLVITEIQKNVYVWVLSPDEIRG